MQTKRMYMAAAAAGVTALIAGCGSSPSTVTVTSASTSGTATASSATSAATTASAASQASSATSSAPVTVKGAMGDTLTLQGDPVGVSSPASRTKVQIRLKAMRGPFAGFNIPAGKKLIGFDMEIVNVGTAKFSDPLPDGTLTLVGGDTGKPTSLIAVGGKNPCDNPSLKLTHGQSKGFCLAFEVAAAAKPQALQYVSDNGYGDTGLWRLNG